MKVLWRVTKEAKQYRGYLIAAGLSTLIVTGLNLIGPRLLTLIVDDIVNGLTDESIKNVLYLAGGLLTVYLVRVLFRFLANVLAHKAAWNIVETVRIKLYSKIQTFSSDYFTKSQTGDLMSRIISDTATFEMLYAHIIPEGITNAITLVGVTIILFSMNAKLALLTCIPIPFIIVFGVIFATKIRPIFRDVQESLAGINVQLHDNFAGIQEIRAFGQAEREENKILEKLSYYTTNMVRGLFKSGIFQPSVEFLTSLGTIIVVGIGGYFAYKGQISVSYIVGFLFYLGLFYAPITGLTQLLEQAQQALAGAERVIEVLDTPIDIKTEVNAVPLETCEGAISFEDVSFHYKEGIPILNKISFEAKPGQFVAFVGPTGVGKTTMVKLAVRFYDPVSGVVRLDGHNLRDITLESLRKHIAFVPQDTFLFNCTIAENIAFARPEATMEEIVNAAKIARIHDDIMMMPHGYETMTGERGVMLSGGQKQRIAIARAVICGAPVLILDEATSSVDAETERMIQRSIDDLAGNYTIIAIAHRLSTIKNADLILVFQDGDIVQRGTHNELINRDGLYKKMYNLQSVESVI